MAITLTFGASIAGKPTAYSVSWIYNGIAQPAISVPAVAGQATYTRDFATDNPSITLKPADAVDATVDAFDAITGLSSSVVTPPAVTVPTPPAPVPPGPPQNVTLVIS